MKFRKIEISLAVGLLCALVWCALEPGFLMSWWGAAVEPLCDGVLTAEGEGGVSFTADARKTGSLCERALEIIGQHYMDEDLSLASLSAMLDVSPNHLSACIKKSEGETFINIQVRRRMEKAQALLLTTDMQIQEIARCCGYTDQHYFSYCFKKYSGTSPVALRRARAAGEART